MLGQLETLTITSKVLEGDVIERIKNIPDNSVHLIVTSPPYGEIKNYSGRPAEIGHGQDLVDYHNSLKKVWKQCERILHPGCRMVINIGDEFLKTTKNRIFQVIPHHAYVINQVITSTDFVYSGDIQWSKVTNSSTSGGGKVMGSVFTPRDGQFFINREYILVFKLPGKKPEVDQEFREASKFTIEERRVWFKDNWKIPPVRQTSHIAMFPEELPERLVRMYSFVGETVFDPFAGSGTTLAMAAKWNRNSIGCELGFGEGDGWKKVMRDKVTPHLKNELEFH